MFSLPKTQSSAEALTAVPCHGEKSSTGKQRSIYSYHIFHSSSVHNLSIILKTVYIILINSIRSNNIKAFLFLFGFKKNHENVLLGGKEKKIIIDRLFPSLSGGKGTK